MPGAQTDKPCAICSRRLKTMRVLKFNARKRYNFEKGIYEVVDGQEPIVLCSSDYNQMLRIKEEHKRLRGKEITSIENLMGFLRKYRENHPFTDTDTAVA